MLLLDLQGNYVMNSGVVLGNFREAGEFHCSHVQVENMVSVTCESLNIVRTMTARNIFSHTNPTTQLGVNNESLPSTKGSRDIMHPPFGVGVNRRQQIPQLVMRLMSVLYTHFIPMFCLHF